MTTLTHVKRFPLTLEPLMTLMGVSSGYSPAMVDSSVSQSCVSQLSRTLTPSRSALSLRSMHSDSTFAGDGVANGPGVIAGLGIGVAVAGTTAGVEVAPGVGVVAGIVVRVGVGVAAVGLDEDVSEPDCLNNRPPTTKPTTNAATTITPTSHARDFGWGVGAGRVGDGMGAGCGGA